MSLLPLVVLALAQPQVPGPVAVAPEACRKVLASITETLAELRRVPGAYPPSDEVTRLLVQRAASVASQLPRDQRGPAFALALAIGLDDSALLRNNFLLGRIVRDVESDDQRKARLAVLGNPSLQGRRDWCQHFAVSAGLVVLSGSESARAAGILKETLDAQPGGSGFSLADLAADEAGLRLAELVIADPRCLETLARNGALTGVLPALKDLPDGWKQSEIEQKFGGLDDPRFKVELSRVRDLVRKQPGLKTPA